MLTSRNYNCEKVWKGKGKGKGKRKGKGKGKGKGKRKRQRQRQRQRQPLPLPLPYYSKVAIFVLNCHSLYVLVASVGHSNGCHSLRFLS